jgi:ferredoxin
VIRSSLVSGPAGRKLKVSVDRDKCIGAASCAAIAPGTFALDEENKAVVLDEAGWDTNEEIMMAAQSCPTLAVIIEDAETGERLYPKK